MRQLTPPPVPLHLKRPYMTRMADHFPCRRARRGSRAGFLLVIAIALASAAPLSSPARGAAGQTGDIEIQLADKTGILPIVQIPANLPIPLGPNPGEELLATPKDLGGSVLYGMLQNGSPDGVLTLAVYRQPDGTEQVILDLNDNEDLTDDQRFTWSGSYGPRAGGLPTLPSFKTQIQRPCPAAHSVLDLSITLRRFEKDKAAASVSLGLTNGIIANLDSYREGTVQIGAKTYKVALLPVVLAGSDSPFTHPGAGFVIDLNGDGRLDGHPFRGGERYRAGVPFTIGDRSYKVKEASCDGHRVVLTPVDPKAIAPPPKPSPVGQAPGPGERAPDFALATIDGDTVRLSDLRGKVVLLDFWATWCGPCRLEMPYVKSAFDRYHDRGLEIIGVSLDNTPTEVRAYTKMSGMSWPQILQGRGTMTPLKQSYGIRTIPAAFLIDQQGMVAATHPRGDHLLQSIENLLAGEGS